MLRYYSHYTFIYPDIYLKNHIVETDGKGHIIKVFPFTDEIEKTEFYSGLLIFIPSVKEYVKDNILREIAKFDFKKDNIKKVSPDVKYLLHHEEDFIC